MDAGHGKGAAIKEKASRIITHSREFCQVVHSSETTMIILEVSPESIQDCRDDIDTWNCSSSPWHS